MRVLLLQVFLGGFRVLPFIGVVSLLAPQPPRPWELTLVIVASMYLGALIGWHPEINQPGQKI